MKSIDCVLLAAGSSARMGGVPKLLTPLGTGAVGNGDAGARTAAGLPCTLLDAVLANHLASRVRWICAVVPGWIPGFAGLAERHRQSRGTQRVRFLATERPTAMSESLKSGWAWVAANLRPDAVMVSLADKPLVDAETINLVIDAYLAGGRDICVPVYRGERGHPVIIGSTLGGEIMALEGDRGAGQVVAACRDRVTEVAVDSDAVLFDVDSAGDVEILKARLGASGRP